MNNQKFLKELEEEGILTTGGGIDELNQLFRKEGVLVSESIGRMRVKYKLDEKSLGINVTSKESKQFFSDHVKMGEISLLPKRLEDKLQRIESSVRQNRRLKSLGFENKFMDLETFKEHKQMFEQKKEEYFTLSEEIANEWELLVSAFKKELKEVLLELQVEKEKLKEVEESVYKKIPSKEVYKNSFYFNLKVKPIPSVGNIEMFSEEMKESILHTHEEEMTNFVQDLVVQSLADVFTLLGKGMKQINKNGFLNKNTRDSIETLKQLLSRRNIVGNVTIKKSIQFLDKTLPYANGEEGLEEIELFAAQLYAYAKEMEFEDAFVYTEDLKEQNLQALVSLIAQSA